VVVASARPLALALVLALATRETVSAVIAISARSQSSALSPCGLIPIAARDMHFSHQRQPPAASASCQLPAAIAIASIITPQFHEKKPVDNRILRS
jgi:hypothetical protein